jgi:hypothetical protein
MMVMFITVIRVCLLLKDVPVNSWYHALIYMTGHIQPNNSAPGLSFYLYYL